MSCLGMFRVLSHAFADLSVRQGSGGNSTDRRQDKSRELRPGWMAEDRGNISTLARGAFSRQSLHILNTQARSTFDAPRMQKQDARG